MSIMQLVRFGAVSGVGWTLDFLVFSLLVYFGTAPAPANALGATLAVAWVYAASVRRIFRYRGASLHGTFAAYAIFQVVGIVAASWVVGALVEFLGLPPLLAKVLVTPCTFLTNYLFMVWLTASPLTASPPAGVGREPVVRPRILVFVPMYQCEQRVGLVLARIREHLSELVDEVLVVDNGSRDSSCAVAAAALPALGVPATLLINNRNEGLGGSHKVAFAYAIAGEFDWVVVVHGDDQADPADLAPLIVVGALADRTDALLGSRFCHGSRRLGYAWHRTWGNHCFNLLFSVVVGRGVTDLGSGLNAFRVAWLRTVAWSRLADDLTFNVHLLLLLVHSRAGFSFFPISWREDGQVSNVRLFRQAWRTIGIAWGYFWLRGAYLAQAHVPTVDGAYGSKLLVKNG